MALGRSSRFQSNFAGWLVYFMMHRFKFTKGKGAKLPHVHYVNAYNLHNSIYTKYSLRVRVRVCVCIQMRWWYRTHWVISLLFYWNWKLRKAHKYFSRKYCLIDLFVPCVNQAFRTYSFAVYFVALRIGIILWPVNGYKQWIRFDWTWNEVRASNVLYAWNLIYCFNNVCRI